MQRLLLATTLLLAPLTAQAQIAHANFDTFTFDNGVKPDKVKNCP